MVKRKFRKSALLALSALLLLSLLSPLAALGESAPEARPVTELLDRVKVVGRTSVDEIGLAVHTTGAGIAFYTDCSGDVVLDLTTRCNFANSHAYSQYFTVVVDGERRRECIDNKSVKQTENTLVLASGLAQGMHEIEIYRQTEEVNAACWFRTLTMAGEPIPVPDAPALIEFIGDSITAGYGMTDPSKKGKNQEDPEGQYGTQTYAYQTAQALGLDFQACCTSGYGAYRGWNAGTTNLKDMYPYTAYHHNRDTGNELWAFSRPADIVVINLGTNDASTAGQSKGVTDATFKQAAKELIELVKEKNPGAKVVWVTGMMGVTFQKPLTSLVEEMGGDAAGIFYRELPRGDGGVVGHPDLASHTAAAEALTAFLREKVLPADYEAQFVTPEHMQSLLDKAGDDTASPVRIAQTALTVYQKNGGVSRAALTAAYNDLAAYLGEQAVPGDVNGDGVADIEDTITLYLHCSGQLTLSDAQLSLADLNSDRQVDLRDACVGYQLAAALPEPPDPLPQPTDPQGVTILSQAVENRNGGGYDQVVTLGGDVSTVGRVQFPTWTEKNGQDDIQPRWQVNPKASGTVQGDTARYHVARKDHGMQTGVYLTHVYVYGKNGDLLTAKALDAVTVPKLFGIDVSFWQEKIDWEKVKAQGVRFAILRCGYGQDYADGSQDDPWFERNVSECERLGIPWGAYLFCYARNAQEAKGEAAHVLRLLKGKHPSWPVYLDFEDSTYQGNLSNATLASIATVFCDTVQAAGYRPGIYANAYYWNEKLTDPRFERWSKWVAHYGVDKPGYDGVYDIWQYDEYGHLNGIYGRLDFNYAYVDLGAN